MKYHHPYETELLRFYDHHMRLSAGYNQRMQEWRDAYGTVKWPLDPAINHSRSTIDFLARKSFEHYEIADGTRRILMGENIEIAVENADALEDCPNQRGLTEVEDLIETIEGTPNWPDPTPEQFESPLFDAIWQKIKSWDINVPEIYHGYMGATGNHVGAILDTITYFSTYEAYSDLCAANLALVNRVRELELGTPSVDPGLPAAPPSQPVRTAVTEAIAKLPCKWGGGNDYLACRVCLIEYDYRKQPRPPCGATSRIVELEAQLEKIKHQ